MHKYVNWDTPMVYVTLATHYELFDNVVKPKANDINYHYVSDFLERDK